MSNLKNDRFLKALLKEPVDRTPVWMMRQAGRYLPEYRATRTKAGSFLDLCKNRHLASEVTLQPLERYPLDAAILFSDILTIPDAMGLQLRFAEGEGPIFDKPIRTQSDVDKLFVPDMGSDLKYVMDAVSTIKTDLDGKVPLIGFSGSPWTLATYMVEGGSSKTFGKVKGMLFEQPKMLHQVLDVLAKSVTAYLNAQIQAGAQAVQIFDTWGGILTPRDYREFSLQYMQQIIDGLIKEHDGRKVPVILYTKGGGQWLKNMADTGADCLGVDWTLDMHDARAAVGNQVSLQGNMDPTVLYAGSERIIAEVKTVLESYGHGEGHIFNLGHGIHPGIDPQAVDAFINAVVEFSPQYH
jgi:uroporphyrinogen decarboxylase